MVNINTKIHPNRPKKKTFKVYDIFEIRDWCITNKKFTEDEFHTFWLWWGDGDRRTGPCDRSLRNVPLGYWGWTEKKPYRQLTAEEYREEEGETATFRGDPKDEHTVHKVLTALEPFSDDGDLLVYMEW